MIRVAPIAQHTIDAARMINSDLVIFMGLGLTNSIRARGMARLMVFLHINNTLTVDITNCEPVGVIDNAYILAGTQRTF